MLNASLGFSRWALKGKQGIPKTRCKSQEVPNKDKSESDRLLTLARQRLKKLLSGVQRTEVELLEQTFQELPREELLILFAQVGGVFVIGSLALSAICGVDPLGGFSPAHPNVNHLLCGVGGAAPLIVIQMLIQSDKMPSFIQEYRFRKEDDAMLLLRHLSLSDALLVAAMLSISISFFVFPGLVGSITTFAKSFSYNFVSPEGNRHAFEGALLFVAGLVGVMSGSNLTLCQEEAEVVMEAIKHSDKYYRLTASAGSGPYSAQRQSAAFRKASWQLLADNKNACIFASVLTFLETFYGGILWKMTGDASTAICLFLSIALMQTMQLKSDS